MSDDEGPTLKSTVENSAAGITELTETVEALRARLEQTTQLAESCKATLLRIGYAV